MIIQLYSADWQPVSAAIPASIREASAIRANEVAHFTFSVAHDALDTDALQMAANILVMGRMPARITRRDDSGAEVRLEALGSDDLLNWYMTPRRWTRWNDPTLYPDLADVVKDLLLRFRQKRWTTLADWTGAYAVSNVQTINLPDIGDSVILATEPYYDAERYLASGYIALRYRLPDNALSTGRVVRWTEHVGAENRITVQSRAADSEEALDAAPWGPEIELTHAEEIEDNETLGADVATGGRWIDLRFNLYTEDRETVDNEDETTIFGTTPVLAGVELIWREAGPITAGSIPDTGIALTDTEYNRMPHLKVLKELCDRYKYTYRVRLDSGQLKLDFAQSFGSDRSGEVILSHQGNCQVDTLSECDEEFANVLHCWGAGTGAEQLYVELRDETSIAALAARDGDGERHADFEDTSITTLADLTTKGQAELDRRKAFRRDYVVRTYLENIGDAWVQDTVSIVDPQAGVVRTAEIKELNISDNPQGEVATIGLGAKIVTLVDEIASHLPKQSGYSPQPPLAAPMLRVKGKYEAIHLFWNMVAGATGYDLECSEDDGTTWRTLATDVSGLRYETGLPFGAKRSFRAYAKRGDKRSASSNVVTAYARDTAPPEAPANVSASSITGGIAVGWSRPLESDYSHTVIRLSTLDGFNPDDAEQYLREVIATGVPVEITDGLEAGKRYYARMQHVDTSNNPSPWSAQVSAPAGIVTETPDLTPPPVPTGLAVMTGLRKHVLVWDRHQGPPPLDRYEVQYATRPDGGEWSGWMTASDEVRSGIYSHEGLDLALEYRYRLRAVSRAGVASDWSAVVEAGVPGKVSLSEEVVDRLARERLSQDVQAELDSYSQGLADAGNRLDEAEGRLAAVEGDVDSAEARLTSAENRLTTVEADLDSVEGRVTTAESTLTQHANEIATKVSQTDFNTLEGRVTDAESTLIQHAADIAARVTQTVFDALESRVTDNEAELALHAQEIALRVTQTVFDLLEDRVTTAEANITANAQAISQRVTQTVFDALEGRVDLTESEITQLSDAITAAVTRIANTEAFIAAFTLTPEEISSTVAKIMPGGDLYTTIQQTAEDIALRVLLKPRKGYLWHFDQSLDEGVSPLSGAVATLRPGEGRFGGAVAVEEGTTNLASNPTFSGAVGTTPSGWNSDVTIQQDNFFGQLINVAELLCVSGNAYEDFGTSIAYPLAYNTTYTISFWARGTMEPTYELWTSRGIASATWKSKPPMSLQWQRYEVTIVTASSGSIYPFWWFLSNVNDVNVGKWVRIARIQLEQKPFATSFVDGTRTEGELEYPLSVLGDSSWTIAVWIKRNYTGLYQGVAGFGSGSSDTDFLYWILNYEGSLYLGLKVNGTTYFSGSWGADPHITDVTNWHQHVIKVDNQALKARYYIDGELFAEKNLPSACQPVTSYQGIGFGRYYASSGIRSILLDELLIVPYAASENEIKSWYSSQYPLMDVVSEINLSPEGTRIAGKHIQLDGDTRVTGPLTIQDETGGAVKVEHGRLMFLADTMFQTAPESGWAGKNITSAETRPITTDSEGYLGNAYPVIIDSASGVRIYKRGLNVWSGASGEPDLIRQGIVQPSGIAGLPASKIVSGILPFDRLPARILRTGPGAQTPTIYWGSVYLPLGGTVTVTFTTAMPYSNLRVFLFPERPNISLSIDNLSATGFRIVAGGSSSSNVYWLAVSDAIDSGSGSGCGSCEVSCQASGCQDSCEDNCQDNCQIGICQDACENVCQDACENVCQVGCQIRCQTDPIMWI